ncbi:histone deacetylase 6 isoform X1 [Rosa chinensis]|uniref:histone deacetylase 6 isoform X1 n=1 Tax=Rosa chinensis TaxID=74649 RepID=UPI000D090833|nr:histone deacetylase 6 isoform X1 [Rosa chinensis]
MATHGGSSSSPPLQENPIVEDDLDLLYGAESGWVDARTSCDHLPSLSSDLVHIPTPDTHCNRCQHPSENWLCLCCKEVLCSRFVNKHMLQHYQQINHSVALSYSDLSVWCFSCDAYLDAQLIPQLRPVYETAYLLKFGEAPPIRSVNAQHSQSAN